MKLNHIKIIFIFFSSQILDCSSQGGGQIALRTALTSLTNTLSALLSGTASNDQGKPPSNKSKNIRESLISELNNFESADSLFKEFGLSKAPSAADRLLFKEEKIKIDKWNKEFVEGKQNVFLKFTEKTFKKLTNFGLIRKNMLKEVVGRVKRFTGFIKCSFKYPLSIVLPENFSWRSKIEFPVRDQGLCGACWATSGIAALEYYNYIQYNNTNRLSVQQSVDCSTLGYGCEGGFPTDVFDLCLESGIVSESSYQYTKEEGQCKNTNSMPKVMNSTAFRSYCVVNAVNEVQIAYIVMKYGPVPAAVCATGFTFEHYAGGVLTPKDCTCEPDHAILIVGFGKDPITGLKYWECKNSWSSGWGEAGYFKIQFGVGCCSLLEIPEAIIVARP
uniref:CSON003798 protein n=1 Tax=Culicoides sonorensis TaxID=179676 RepID=A0A336L606_CULSO